MVDFHEGIHREKKSRKVHTCDDCKQDIQKGEVYIRNSIRINGVYTSLGRHIDCVQVSRLCRSGLMTGEGFPLALLPGFQKRPDYWFQKRLAIYKSFPLCYDNLIKSGLSPLRSSL